MILSIIISSILSYYILKQTNIAIAIITFILTYIPTTQIATEILQYILNKSVKPTLIPKMDYSTGIPEEETTMVIIPTIVKTPQKVKDLISKLEVFYLANKSENIYFTLLGDASTSSKEKEEIDEEIIKTGIKEIGKLNQKYANNKMGKFQFIYRKRVWNQGEGCFLGWERKRGMIHLLNEYLLGKIENPFRANTIEEWKQKNSLPKIKYIITLDSDTNLVLNSGLELIGAAAHILNSPELNSTKDAVINGHALIQPRIGIDLVSARMSIFTKIFAGSGGVDPYANAVSDVYQDNFQEGIFTGKGIYNLEVFSKVLSCQIPENTVLSHDLLEGSYLRCALASDILLLDGYPYKYNAFIGRLSRWIRGDWQIIKWIMPKIKTPNGTIKKNPLNLLSKFKILDNLRRSLVEIFVMLALIVLCTYKLILGIDISPVCTVMLIAILLPSLLDLISYIAQIDDKKTSHKTFAKNISLIKGILYRGVLALAFLPHKAYISLDAIVRTIYRMTVSKKHLLQWTTAEEAEKNAKTNYIAYFKSMSINVISGIVGIITLLLIKQNPINIILYAIFVLWIIAPQVACYISKKEIKKAKVKELSNDEINYVLEIGKKTWDYFETYINKQNNYLPPDNYQEDRPIQTVNRTSSTNIGLGLISIISAYDLGYIDLQKAITMIKNMLETIQKLSKWNGHLYNWYNIETLQPLIPRYISTVDSGNFIGYLYTLKEFLTHILLNNTKKETANNVGAGTKKSVQYTTIKTNETQQIDNQIINNTTDIQNLLDIVNKLIEDTDFRPLYDYEKRLFSIGFNIEENKLTDSYYDLLASEARQASLVAIAKHDIPSKHWQNLSRTLTEMFGYKGLVSWSGTAFEYLMPNINIPKYEGSMLDESCNFLIMSQKEYAKKLGIPWGISESAFNLKDLNSNYQYKAFGIPWLGLKRGLADEMVVSSYGSVLAITDMPKEVVKNLKELEKCGMNGKYGFYEAIDYTPERLRNKHKFEIVKTYMAHHQALILLSINNLINNNILQERFIGNPDIKAVDILLQEKMPEDVIITKEKKEKIQKLKTIDYENYTTRVYTKLNPNLNNFNVIANDNYTVVINEQGEGFSKYKDILVNRYKPTNEYPQGIEFFIKNIRTKRIWSTINSKCQVKPDKYEINFMQDMDKFIRCDENIKTTLKIITAPDDPVEIRTLELQNLGNLEETLEISSYFEPVLSTKEQDYSHMAFNNLFLKYEYLEDTNSLLVKRNKRGQTKQIFLGVNLYTQNETIGELEYEIDEEKLNGGKGLGIPKMIENSIPFSKKLGLSVSPVIALKRTIKVKPNEKVALNLIITVSEDKEKIEENIKKYINQENIKRAFELSKVRVEEEARYLRLKGSDIEIYQKILSYLIVQNPMKKLFLQPRNEPFQTQDLWKYGISGDLPILLVKIKDVNDSYVIKEILKAYEFFKVKNIEIDLVILNEEENVYERYVKEAVQIEIQNRHLMYLINQKGGIFLLNANEIEDKDLLEFRANIILDAHLGNIKTIIKDLEEEYMETISDKNKSKNQYKQIPNYEKRTNLIDMEHLKYYNEYGGFSEDGKEYIIKMTKDIKPQVPWAHVLANPNFGTVITNNNSGYTWYKNSRLSRITKWSNDVILDTPAEVIYIKDNDYGKIWSLCPNLNQDDEEYYMTYGFGYAKLTAMRMGLLQEQTTFVPKEDNIKVSILRLKNTTPEKKDLNLVYYINPVLGEDEIKTDGYISLDYNKNSNIIYAKNMYTQDIKEQKLYISSSEKIKSYTGNRKNFFGNGDLKNPTSIEMDGLENENSLGVTPCVAIQISVELKAFEDKEIVFVLGADSKETQSIAYKYTIPQNAKEELENTKRYFSELIRKIRSKNTSRIYEYNA